MPRFYHDFASKQIPRKLPDTPIRRFVDRFTSTHFGDWLTRKWRNTVPHWLRYAFVRGVMTIRNTEDDPFIVARWFNVPKRFAGFESPKKFASEFVLVGTERTSLRPSVKEVIWKMHRHRMHLNRQIQAIQLNNNNLLDPKTRIGIDVKRLMQTTQQKPGFLSNLKLKKMQDEYDDLTRFLTEYVRQRRAYWNFGQEEKAAQLRAGGIGKGADFQAAEMTPDAEAGQLAGKAVTPGTEREGLFAVYERENEAKELEERRRKAVRKKAKLDAVQARYARGFDLSDEERDLRRQGLTQEEEALANAPGPISGERTKLPTPVSSSSRIGGERSNSVYFKGRYYYLAPGQGGFTDLFVQNKPQMTLQNILWAIHDWKESSKVDTHPYPPEDMRNVWFNMNENRLKRGEQVDENVAKTVRNIGKRTGDQAYVQWGHRLVSEIFGKRWRLHGVTHVTGRVLARAVAEFSAEAGNLIPPEEVPGHDDLKKIPLIELHVEQLLAVTRLMVGGGLPGSRTKVGWEISPERSVELQQRLQELEEKGRKENKPEGRDEDKTEIDAIKKSMDNGIDYLYQMDVASLKAHMKDGIRPYTEFVINHGGCLDVSTVKIDEKGKTQVFMPKRSRGFVVQRWNIPTVSSNSLSMLNAFFRTKPFVEFITKLGKRQDTNLYWLSIDHRQQIKELLGQSFHDGSVDTMEDAVIRITSAFQLDENLADHYYLVLHEIATRANDGGTFDHLRRQVYEMTRNLDEDIKTFYFGSGKDTEQNRELRYSTYNRRGEFLHQLTSDKRALAMARSVSDDEDIAIEARKRAKREMREGAIEKSNAARAAADAAEEASRQTAVKLEKHVQDMYGQKIAVVGHDITPSSHRIHNIANWLTKYGEVFTTFLIGPSEIARVGRASEGLFVESDKWYAKAAGKAAA